jgi:antitoxin component YwqK of YwqJK toxin-antitoxin module
LVEEGYWNKYGFYGYYHSYYRNGKLKSEGLLREDLEVGMWVYYKTDGSVFRVINYPYIIKGEVPNNKSSYDLKTAIKLYAYPSPQDSINFVNSVKGRWLKRYR